MRATRGDLVPAEWPAACSSTWTRIGGGWSTCVRSFGSRSPCSAVKTGYHHVTLRGHVAELMADPQFTDIDRLSEHYTGRAYPQRDGGRVSDWIDVMSWHAWLVIEPWTGGR